MPKFLLTTKSRTPFNGIHIEPGMSVEVVTRDMTNPLTMKGGQPVVDAFMRIYGIDIKKGGGVQYGEFGCETNWIILFRDGR